AGGIAGQPVTTSHGTVTVSTTGAAQYTPQLNYTGDDSFTFQLSDGFLLSNVATVTLHVTATGDRPPTAVGDAYTTAKDTPLSIAARGVLANDSDPDGDPIYAVLLAGFAHGTGILYGDGSFRYKAAAGYFR